SLLKGSRVSKPGSSAGCSNSGFQRPAVASPLESGVWQSSSVNEPPLTPGVSPGCRAALPLPTPRPAPATTTPAQTAPSPAADAPTLAAVPPPNTAPPPPPRPQ